MSVTVEEAQVSSVPEGSHVGWVVYDAEQYGRTARAFLARGKSAGEKLVAFGPKDSPALLELEPHVSVAADPHDAFLGGGALDPETMFAMFREQVSAAKADGYRGLRVMADMDWMLPAAPTTDDVQSFELLLDRAVLALGATVVCAYRAESFDADTILATMSVHPTVCGVDDPPFSLTAVEANTWALSGEIDILVARDFARAIDTALGSGPCAVDVTDLRFIDVGGMRSLALACARANGTTRFVGVSPSLRRFWKLGCFDQIAPLTEA